VKLGIYIQKQDDRKQSIQIILKMNPVNLYLQPWSLAGITGITGVSGVTRMTGMTGVAGVA
jgi:hypothetical protein